MRIGILLCGVLLPALLATSVSPDDPAAECTAATIVSRSGETVAWPSGVHAGFTGTDERLPCDSPPETAAWQREWQTAAWRGERIHTQFAIQTTEPLERIRIDVSPLKGRQGTIPASAIRIDRVEYVLTDGLSAEGSGCGISPEIQARTSLSADLLDPDLEAEIKANSVQPFWLGVQIPAGTRPGRYASKVKIRADRHRFELPFEIEVGERRLPPPAEWSFHLDLWQNPFSVARWHGVEPWSDEHFERLRPYMEMLARAGQKSVTVSMIHDPWNGQTYDIYDSMIRWTKHADGTWSYDYDVFDRWVEFMESVGIDRLINCYSMVPWNNRFSYYDEAMGRDTVLVARPGSPEYEELWAPMLRDFARHLRATGRFAKTAIAMDERPLEAMLAVIRLIRRVEPEFRISLAGNYHARIDSEIHDYCIALADDFPPETLARRRAEGRISTFYTCCQEGHPNTFTFSPPAEASWMGWYAAAKGYDGYLRWAYNCWPEDPLHDSRYGTWSGGDCFLVYPGARSSIRFERLVEGIQDYEKIRILKDEFTRENRTDELLLLEGVLQTFDPETLAATDAAQTVNRAKRLIMEF